VNADAEIVPSPASTVVLLRADASDAARFEVLLLRRNSQLAFYGGAWVFPGGRIDAQDGSDPAQAARGAAIRELREETGLVVRADELVHFAQWVTPPGRPRRFDTFYFAARAPAGSVQVDQGEVDAYRWMQPAAALAASAGGEIELPPPTFVTLVQLAGFAGLETAYRALAAPPLQRFEPRPCPSEGGGLIYLYEGDAGYPDRNPLLEGPRHRLVAVGSVFRYERSG
jgi:8-oxo-dGTP pyrophosphatase MutT (NUDIX family)